MNQPYRSKIKGIKLLTTLSIFLLSLGLPEITHAADAVKGEKLFKATCAACHKPDKDNIGPALQGAMERWAEAGIGDKIYDWVRDPKKIVAEGHPYVTELVARYTAKGTPLMTGQPFSNEEIDNIFAYVANPPAQPQAKVEGDLLAGAEEKESGKLWWIILGVIFAIIAISAGSVRRQLVNANREKHGEGPLPDVTYWEIWKAWGKRNGLVVTFLIVIFALGGILDGWFRLKDVGVFENYKPVQPIEFPHDLHAGINKIPCQYCHSTTEKSKHASIPSPMLCMNCHKAIDQGSRSGATEIAKIYDAVGFDPATLEYSGETKPIQWVKVHNLPDHVYFSHQQHVVAGKLDCSQCHGDMTKETVARVMPHEELSAQKANIDAGIKMERATLTMGWCIECHYQAKVQESGSGYYTEMKERLLLDQNLLRQHMEDGKITVEEMGGWECAKCHY